MAILTGLYNCPRGGHCREVQLCFWNTCNYNGQIRVSKMHTLVMVQRQFTCNYWTPWFALKSNIYNSVYLTVLHRAGVKKIKGVSNECHSDDPIKKKLFKLIDPQSEEKLWSRSLSSLRVDFGPVGWRRSCGWWGWSSSKQFLNVIIK